jgi:excisionase family DNA binding protein
MYNKILYLSCMEKFYTVDEVAAQLKVHPRTIRRKIKSGEIHAPRVGKQYRIGREQLMQLSALASAPGNKVEVSVSSIIEIQDISDLQGMELSTKMTSIFFTGGFAGSIHCAHDPKSKKMKLFLDCGMEQAPELFSILKLFIRTTTNGTENG